LRRWILPFPRLPAGFGATLGAGVAKPVAADVDASCVVTVGAG
jgi:hypothetical protein